MRWKSELRKERIPEFGEMEKKSQGHGEEVRPIETGVLDSLRSRDHVRETLHVCNDERNRELCVVGFPKFLPLIKGSEEGTVQPMGPWPLRATVMLMREAQGVNGEASLLPA